MFRVSKFCEVCCLCNSKQWKLERVPAPPEIWNWISNENHQYLLGVPLNSDELSILLFSKDIRYTSQTFPDQGFLNDIIMKGLYLFTTVPYSTHMYYTRKIFENILLYRCQIILISRSVVVYFCFYLTTFQKPVSFCCSCALIYIFYG